MNIRHGDLCLIGIDKLPDGLKAADTKVLMTGSHGNDHTFDHGKLYPCEKGGNIIGFLEAYDNTTLYHPDHGARFKGQKLRRVGMDAGIYELRRQTEETHAGMRPVVD